MDKIEVEVKNWPKKHYLEHIPTFIAIIALLVSLYSVCLTRKSFTASHRPYVWASNYGVIDPNKKTIVPIPFRVAYRVKNAPAKIIKTGVIIRFNNDQLFSYTGKNMVRFPDYTSEWNFSFSKEVFNKIMNRPDEEKSKLSRHISLEYSPLDGGNTYHYSLHQTFSITDNQWKDISEEVD